MQFRKDLNGLRAIAVIAVVLFHFNPAWLPGGFAGVDVFFVISGFLMTGIIFKGLENQNFSTLKFYVARANRIIPALFVLCFTLLVFGGLFLSPAEYKSLGSHASGSVGFVSNFFYWRESGYFDASSKEKWLLHTWSLSVEWQFYVIYPILLVAMRKFLSLQTMKVSIVIGTVIGFIFCALTTSMWPNSSYYLLPTRAWELMIGGVAYLYPLELKDKRKKVLEFIGLALIICSYLFISEDIKWPGYLAIIPVLGAVFVILSQRNDSFITCNYAFQKIGKWSYSIYLWHWPLVVGLYYFSVNESYIYPALVITVILGFLSNRYVEGIRFRVNFNTLGCYLKCKPIYMTFIIVTLGGVIFLQKGFVEFASKEYKEVVKKIASSPYRQKCHIAQYQSPELACEYPSKTQITWAVFGDSHSTEIAYALAENLKLDGVGLKHFTYSGCSPAFKEAAGFSKCAKWYNDTVEYLLDDPEIRNIVLNHRFTKAVVGKEYDYPKPFNTVVTDESVRTIKHLDDLILLLASKKDNIYIFYPIPELQRNIHSLVGSPFKGSHRIKNVSGTDLAWYQKRNEYMINHFDNANYPDNVHLLKPQDKFCDDDICYAVKDGIPLYFDSDHPSISGAEKLVDLIKYGENK